jgi:hypothetical protein
LRLLLRNEGVAGVGDAAGLPPSAAAGVLWGSLHTGETNPAAAAGATQATQEVSYAGYGRIPLSRDAASGLWAIEGRVATNALELLFAVCSGGAPGTVAWLGIGTAAAGAGLLVECGSVAPRRVLEAGSAPVLEAGSVTVLEN